ncbi:MAG TPA: hypothetical protein PLQ82_05230 [Desulfobacteraceae bacterium]|nr:hypothetical protein [Desulfobacteraceae bacterium]
MRTNLTLLLLLTCITGAYAQPDDRIAKTPKVNYDWQPGFVSITELTGAIGLGRIDDGLSGYYYGLTTVAGYQFARNIKAGGGLGVHVHEEATLFPVYLDIRYSFNAQEIVPFLAGAGGIMLDFTNIADNTRIFINPSIGLKYVAANRKSVSFSTGLMVTTGGPNARKSFINFRLGLELKSKK